MAKKRVKVSVKRNIEWFPALYMFELTKEEAEISRPQIATLIQGENIKYLLFLESEHYLRFL